MKNYKDIVELFSRIFKVVLKDNDVTVYGVINNSSTSKTFNYKHAEVAKEVATKIEYFKGI
jgi:hypothetical protein